MIEKLLMVKKSLVKNKSKNFPYKFYELLFCPIK